MAACVRLATGAIAIGADDSLDADQNEYFAVTPTNRGGAGVM